MDPGFLPRSRVSDSSIFKINFLVSARPVGICAAESLRNLPLTFEGSPPLVVPRQAGGFCVYA